MEWRRHLSEIVRLELVPHTETIIAYFQKGEGKVGEGKGIEGKDR